MFPGNRVAACATATVAALCGLSVGYVRAVAAPPAPGAVISLTPDSPAFRDAREPQIAVDGSGRVFVAFGADNALYCATSTDGGRTFAAPVKIGEAGQLSLGMRRGPRIAIAKGKVVVSAVYGQQGKGRDGELVAWRSADGGRTWAGPSPVSDVPGASREGLHAMASAASDGTLACAWLDLREKGTRIYASLSRDGGATWGKNIEVYTSPAGTVCECCHPTVAFAPSGDLLVMWRNWLNGSRDMYLSRSSNGGKTFSPARKLGTGTWPLNACPMDGGALAVASNGSVTTFWRRDQEMYLCAPGTPERSVGRGQQGWITAGPGGDYAVWIVGRPGQLLALLPGRPEPVVIADGANDPVVAAAPGGKGPVVAAWTSGEKGAFSIRATLIRPATP